MKVSKRYYTIVFAVLVSLGMSFFMSLALTLVNMGLRPDFLQIWLIAFAVSFSVSIPVSLVIVPVVKRIVDKLTAG